MLQTSTARLLKAGGAVAGAGVLVTDTLVLTCAHVAVAAGAGPGDAVRLDFPHAGEGHDSVRTGRVRAEGWQGEDAQDVAVVELDRPVDTTVITPVTLGAAADSLGGPVHAYGYPAQAGPGGHFGGAVAAHFLPRPSQDGEADDFLQLTHANDITKGFSGGPVADDRTGRVIGMVTRLVVPDRMARGQHIAYATTSEALRRACPELALAEDRPYPGLEPYCAQDDLYFHGRSAAVERLVHALGTCAGRGGLLLLGPSGAGKTSLVHAGVLPEVAKTERQRQLCVRPTDGLDGPLAAGGVTGVEESGLAGAVAQALRDDPRHDRLLLVVDPLEELLAAATPAAARALRQLTDCLRAHHPGLTLLLVMRDDFYSRLASAVPDFLDAPDLRVVNVPAALTRDEITEIIEEPARKANHSLQEGLRDRIIDQLPRLSPDSGGQDPGHADRFPVTLLPLLQLTLRQLWEHRTGGALTHDAYRSAGEVTRILVRAEEALFARLEPRLHLAAQRFLAALVEPADVERKTPATRRRRTIAELRALSLEAAPAPERARGVRAVWGRSVGFLTRRSRSRAPEAPDTQDDADFDTVLRVLTGSPLVTAGAAAGNRAGELEEPGEPVAELVHDALIPAWDNLGRWVERDRRFTAWLDTARRQYARWEPHGDAQDLLSGTALEDGRVWRRQRRLPSEMGEFVAASERHARRAVRRARRLNVTLALLLVLVLTAAGLAQWQRTRTHEAQQVAQARQLASASFALAATDPELAAVLAVAAYRRSPTQEAADSLYQASDRPLLRILRTEPGVRPVTAMAFAPDTEVLALGLEDGRTQLWHPVAARRIATLAPRAGKRQTESAVVSVVPARDGVRLMTGDANGVKRLWDTTTSRVLRTFRGEPQATGSAAVSPDWRSTTVSTAHGDVLLLDPATGKTRFRLRGHREPVGLVAYSPDGRTVATGSDDETVRLWDTRTGRHKATLPGHGSGVTAVAFSRDGKRVATVGGGEHTARVWDVGKGRLTATVREHTGAVNGLAFDRPGKRLATASDDGFTFVNHADTGVLNTYLSAHAQTVNAVSYSPDGNLLATAGDDGTTRLYEATKHADRMVLRGSAAAQELLAFSPDSTLLATADHDGRVRIWATGRVRPLPQLDGHNRPIRSMEFSQDGKDLVTTAADRRTLLWDTRTGVPVRRWDSEESLPDDAIVSSVKDTVITMTDDAGVTYWDRTDGSWKGVLTGHEDAVNDLAVTPDGESVATAGEDGTVRLWFGPHPDAGVIEPERAVLRGHRGAVVQVEFGPDGRILVSEGRDGTVRLWDTATGRALHTLRGSGEPVAAFAVSPDSRTVSTYDISDRLRLWDTGNGTLRAVRDADQLEARALVFSPDGRTLASAGADGSVVVRSADTAEESWRRVPDTRVSIQGLAFSPDGTLLASCDAHGTVRLWDTRARKQVAALKGMRAFPEEGDAKVAFSADGALIAMSSGRTVRLVDVESAVPERALQRVCRMLRLDQSISRPDDAQDEVAVFDAFDASDLEQFLAPSEISGLCP
ncbi:nSTAND1 domain-containing NTPase [Streptomyces sp. NPDC001920]